MSKQANALAVSGRELCNHGRYEEALPKLIGATNLEPENYRYWYNLAIVYDRLADNERMEHALRKCIERQGNYTKAFVRLINLLERQNRVEEAAEAASTGLMMNPENGDLKKLKERLQKKQEDLSFAEAKRLQEKIRRESKGSRDPDPTPIATPVVSRPKPDSKSSPRPSRDPIATGNASANGNVRKTNTPATKSRRNRDPPSNRSLRVVQKPKAIPSQPAPPPIPPNRRTGRVPTQLPRYKDQCKTYVLAPGQVQPIPEAAPQAPPLTNTARPTRRKDQSKTPRWRHEL